MNANAFHWAWNALKPSEGCETDNSRMMVRIMEARTAIDQRLLLPIEGDSEEYRELRAAQKALVVLKTKRDDMIQIYD